jgi:hypothetical protein
MSDRHLPRVYLAIAILLLNVTIAGIGITTQNLAWSDTASCDSAGLCEGSNGDDVINNVNKIWSQT